MTTSRSVLVTGGAGYIGAHTAKALHRAGITPVVYNDLSNGHRAAVQWGPLVVGDVRDRDHLVEVMNDYGISGVIHFAGLIEVGRSTADPAPFWDINVNGVAAVLWAMRETGVRRMVFSSTAAVYGQPTGAVEERLAESAPTLPINPYGDGKLAAERMIAAHASAYGLEGVALRYFNAAGADEDGDLGEAHRCESHLIPLAIEAALGLGPALTVFGADFPTPDGACLRDYVHVSDLARAHCLALDLPLSGERFAAFNLGGGRGHSVFEVLAAVEQATGRPSPHQIGARRAGDPPALVADCRKAAERLGWHPHIASLSAIVASAVAWRRAPRFGFRPQLAVVVS